LRFGGGLPPRLKPVPGRKVIDRRIVERAKNLKSMSAFTAPADIMGQMHADDMDLVREFAASGSDAAFATLVRRHINLVYSAALRRLGKAPEAEEVAQAVFIILAKKAGSLRRGTILSGWLYQTAQLTAANFHRAAVRRQRREQEAFMQFSEQSEPDGSWHRLGPLLEEAMARLGPRERDAVVLRFFENCTVREVAATLGVREDAVQKRVNRATDKLRDYFVRRGIRVSTAALLAAMGTHAVQAAPVELASKIAATAALKSAAGSGSTLTLVKGVLKIMAWTNMKTATVAGIATILAIGTTTVAVKKLISPRVEYYFSRFETMDLDKAPPVLILRPSRYARQGDYIITTKMDLHNFGKVMRRGCTFGALLASAYDFGPERMVLPADAPKGRYDLLLTLPHQPAEALREAIKKQFGFVGHPETRDTDVLVLKVSNPAASGLKINTRHKNFTINWRKGELVIVNFKMSDIAYCLGTGTFNMPVIDETGLTDAYDFDLHWNGDLNLKGQNKDIERALKEQLGLELVPDRRPLEMLVVEKAR
jgi:uncharacterized protein (TIGR03435 family)